MEAEKEASSAIVVAHRLNWRWLQFGSTEGVHQESVPYAMEDYADTAWSK